MEARSALIQLTPPTVNTEELMVEVSEFQYELSLSDKQDGSYTVMYRFVTRAISLLILTVLEKKQQTFGCYIFDAYEPILIILGRSVNDKASSQNMFYFSTLHDCCRKQHNVNTRIIFYSLKCYITALPVFNQSQVDFFNLGD